MLFILEEKIKYLYLNMFGNGELLKGISIKEIPGQVLMPPDYTPMKRQIASEKEDDETNEEKMRKFFWQSKFQKTMILHWLSERNKSDVNWITI